MSNKDIKKLTDLAKEKLGKQITRDEALRSFVSAGIMNSRGQFTKPYQNLGRVVKNK
ncbi:MAG: hypothetical protein H7Y13_10250 [Sphingobacteriaceae bacterium]|nr:hypothetical protein [Sphingobacteriaceae bacterium]